MSQKENLRNKYDVLLTYMRDLGYSNSTIENMRRAVFKVLSLTDYPSPNDYNSLIIQSKHRTSKHNFRIIKEFDIDGKLPILNYRKPYKEHLYAILSSEFAIVRDSYTNIGIERGLTEKTVTIYKSVTCAFLLYMHNLGYRFFKDISEKEILEYFSTSKIGADQCRYIKSVLSDCSNLIESESVERVITLMPQMPRVQKVIDFLTKHEIEAIKDVILSDDGKMPLRDKAICALAMFTGLRSIDIVNLKFDDLHWDSNEIVFVQTKTSHIVRVPIRPLVGNYLYRYITEERPQVKSEQIFITKGKWPRLMQATMTYNISKKLFKIAGLRNDGRRKGLHLLRHNLAATMLCNDIDMSVISSILGHKSPKTVEKYLSCDIELLRGCSISIADYPVTNLIYTDTYEITYV